MEKWSTIRAYQTHYQISLILTSNIQLEQRISIYRETSNLHITRNVGYT